MVLELTRVAENTALPAITALKGLGMGITANKPDVLLTLQNDAGIDIKALAWDHDTDSFGAIVTTDSAPIAVNNAVATSPNGDVLFAYDLIGGVLHAWALSGGVVGAHLSSIATALGNLCGLAMTSDQTLIVIAGSTAPYVKYCAWDGANFSGLTTPTAPSTAVPTNNAPLTGAVAMAPDDSAVAVAIGVGDIAVYPVAGGALGAKVEPSGAKTFTTGTGCGAVAWNPDSDVVFLAGDNSPFCAAYAWNGSLTTAFATPTIAAAGAGVAIGIVCDAGGQAVFLCGADMDSSRAFYAYPWDGADFGARVDPNVAPAATVNGIALSPDATRVFTRDGAQDVEAWETGLTLSSGSASGGTLTGNVPEGRLRGGGGTVVITIDGDTFVPVITPTIVQDIVDGMVGSGPGPREWNNTGKPGATVDRDSDTQITITIPPLPGYDTDAGETITITLPASALDGGAPLIITPDPAFTITAGPPPAGRGPQPWQSAEREALRVLATAQGTEVRQGVQALERTLQELLVEVGGATAAGPFPTDREKLYDAIFVALSSERVRNVKDTYILDAIERFLP